MIGPNENGDFEKLIPPTEDLAERFNNMEPRQARRERRIVHRIAKAELRQERKPKSKSNVRWFRRGIFVIPLMVAIAISGVAAAFFIGEGSGTGTSKIAVGTASTVAVTVAPATNFPYIESLAGTYEWTTIDPLQPVASAPANPVYALFSVKTTQPAKVSTLTPSVNADGSGNVLNAAAGNAPVAGCQASWFQVGPAALSAVGTPILWRATGGVSLPYVMSATNQTETDIVGFNVWLKDSGTDQSACAGVSPELTLTVG